MGFDQAYCIRQKIPSCGAGLKSNHSYFLLSEHTTHWCLWSWLLPVLSSCEFHSQSFAFLAPFHLSEFSSNVTFFRNDSLSSYLKFIYIFFPTQILFIYNPQFPTYILYLSNLFSFSVSSNDHVLFAVGSLSCFLPCHHYWKHSLTDKIKLLNTW